MAKGWGLLVGLEFVDPNVDNRSSEFKFGCKGVSHDLAVMENLLTQKGYSVKVLKNQQATSKEILKSMVGIKNKMKAGDIFTFYYSGHGGSKHDFDGDELDDNQDETLIVYDRDLIDDELNAVWTQFPENVRILMISDSCNSGTNYKAGKSIREKSKPIAIDPGIDQMMKAKLIHIGACRDGKSAGGGKEEDGSPFTSGLDRCLKKHPLLRGYQNFYNELKWYMDVDPVISCYGPVDEQYLNEAPFQID